MGAGAAASNPMACTSAGATAAGGAPPSKKSHQSPRKKGKLASVKSKTLKPGKVDPADILPASELAPPPMDIMGSAKERSSHILRKEPSDVPAYALSEQSQIFFGCASTGAYLRLLEY